MNIAEIKSCDLEFFQPFLNLSKLSLKTGNIPTVKSRQIAFLNSYILPNKSLFRLEGTQLCTTKIAEALSVSSQTVMNWIKRLLKLDMIRCTDTSWKKGLRSRHYIVSSQNKALIEILNMYQGFEGIEHSEAYKIKVQKRKEAWEKFDMLMPNPTDIMRIAGTYVGCADSLKRDLIKKLPLEFLRMPSLMDAHRPYMYEFYRALKIATRNVNRTSAQIDDIPNVYRVPKTFEDFLGDELGGAITHSYYPRSSRTSTNPIDIAIHKVVKHSCYGITQQLEQRLERTHRRVKRGAIKAYLKAMYWVLRYEQDDEYEKYTGQAPYPEWGWIVG